MASPLTFQLNKDGKECVFLDINDIDCSISYYFAVQEGENNDFKLRYEIWTPSDVDFPTVSKSDEVQGEWSFKAIDIGEYALCVYGNDNIKIVDLDISQKCHNQIPTTEDPRLVKGDVDTRIVKSLEDSISLIESQSKVLRRNLETYKKRNERNHFTVKSLESRVIYLSMCGIVLVPTISIIQAMVLRFVQSRTKA